jgi:hypothetical protein
MCKCRSLASRRVQMLANNGSSLPKKIPAKHSAPRPLPLHHLQRPALGRAPAPTPRRSPAPTPDKGLRQLGEAPPRARLGRHAPMREVAALRKGDTLVFGAGVAAGGQMTPCRAERGAGAVSRMPPRAPRGRRVQCWNDSRGMSYDLVLCISSLPTINRYTPPPCRYHRAPRPAPPPSPSSLTGARL